MEAKKELTVKMVEMGLIDEPEGIIRIEIDMEKIDELAESIRAVGQLQPILLRPKDGRYEIIYGHRRFMAVQRLGKARISASVKEIDDETAAIMRATENIARENLSIIEEAAIYQDLRDQGGLRIDQIGRKMGMSAGLIMRRLELLKMPNCLTRALHKKQINYGVAEELWQLGESPEMEYYLMLAIDHGATVLVVRGWVKEKLNERRRLSSDVGKGGGDDRSPMELKPSYYACDICEKPVDLNESIVKRMCQECAGTIKQALEVIK